MNKYRAGRNTRWFTPEGLRELGPSEKVGMEPMAYVKLEGLGKIPFSNIRRPRPLMDLEAKQPASDEVRRHSPQPSRLNTYPLCSEEEAEPALCLEDLVWE